MSPRKRVAAVDAPAEDTVRVALAYPLTTADGEEHKADTEVDLPREQAVELIHYGRARAVDTEAAQADGSEEG